MLGPTKILENLKQQEDFLRTAMNFQNRLELCIEAEGGQYKVN